MLKAIYDTKEEIPSEFISLYSEKGGKWELTGIEGIKTKADVDRVQKALDDERTSHSATKKTFKAFEGMDPAEIQKKLDRIPELEAAAKGGSDDEKIKSIAEARVTAELAPLNRKITELEKENGELKNTNGTLSKTIKTSVLHTAIQNAAIELKVVPSAIPDILLTAERVFEVPEDGPPRTTADAGNRVNMSPETWLRDMVADRPHWWPASEGSGARGTKGLHGVVNNPFHRDHWNITEQGNIVLRLGEDKARELAKAAGVELGATEPAPKKN